MHLRPAVWPNAFGWRVAGKGNAFPMTRKLALLAVVLSAGARLLGQGTPPMITDDTDPPPVGKWEVNLGVTTEHTAGSTAFEAPALDLAYGIANRFELGYSVSYLAEHDSGESARLGMGRSEFDIKWHFFGDGEHGLQIAASPAVDFPTPGSHSVQRGLVEPHTFFRLPFEFEELAGPYELIAEVGPTLPTNPADGTSWETGFLVSREIRTGWILGAEINGQTDARGRESEWIVNVGTAIDLSEDYTLLVSVGRDLSNTLGDKVTLMSYVGLQRTF
jgi:hypothetical protein